MVLPLPIVLLAAHQSGFSKYSFAPAMGYSAPALVNVASQMIHSIEATVTDKDTYQRAVPPNDFQEFPNSLTDIVGTINSGTVLSVTPSYDSTTGKRTKTWVIEAPTVPQDQQIVRYNYFIAKDTENGTITQDANSPQQTTTVVIKGPVSGGGGCAG